MKILLSALGNLNCLTSEHSCTPLYSCSRPSIVSSKLDGHDHVSVPTGGGQAYLFPNMTVSSFIKQGDDQLTPDHVFWYVDHVDDVGCLAYPSEQGFVIVPHVSRQMVQKIAQIHKVPLLSSHWHLTKDELVKLFEGHNCIKCNLYMSVLEAQLSPSLRKKNSAAKVFSNLTEDEKTEQNNKKLGETIIRKWCKETKPSSLEESRCAVCGELVPISQLSCLKAIKKMLGILAAPGETRIEHKFVSQAISEFKGPVLDYRCDKVCDNCRKTIRNGKVPCLALANNYSNTPQPSRDPHPFLFGSPAR
ncbi:hypothetical protein BYT27DRAFT_7222048 [Phlegmacium glaucopus]|nr:hypothetical protein BYT27DRAFT_7222048 [Phlegmacium glaucopus]